MTTTGVAILGGAAPHFASARRRHARLLRILTISAIVAVVLIGLFLRIWILGREPSAEDTAYFRR